MKYENLPINSFKSSGWTEEYLSRQIAGITGNIEKCGVPFKGPSKWADKSIKESWVPYEQEAYWIDGALRCAYISGDTELLKRVKDIIYKVIGQADDDGYLGPTSLRCDDASTQDNYVRWPHAVFFRALTAECDATGEDLIADALGKHFKENGFFGYVGRNVCNIESLWWLWKKTGDEYYSRLAERMFSEWHKIDDDTFKGLKKEYVYSDTDIYVHGVTTCETFKLLPLLYDMTGKQEYLDYAIAATEKLLNQSLMVDGVISSEEFTRSKETVMAHETCDIGDLAWYLGYMFNVTGDKKYLDIIERATMNAAPAVVMPDFKSLQYFSSPNLVIASENSTHCRYSRGMYTMSYRPYGYAACCIGNINRIMPNYIYKTWHKRGDMLVATLYAPSIVETDGMRIVEETDFPFDTTVKFNFIVDTEKKRKLAFRIPDWQKGYKLTLGGCSVESREEDGFIVIDETVKSGDTIEIVFDAKPELKTWVDGGVYLEYGPLLYAFPVPHSDEVFDAKKAEAVYPSHDLLPTGDWNYAIRTDLVGELVPIKTGKKGYVWETPQIEFTLPAEKISGWKIVRTNQIERYTYRPNHILIDDRFVMMPVDGDFTMTPELPDGKTVEETRDNTVTDIKLVPYGCAKLRITVFPKLDK